MVRFLVVFAIALGTSLAAIPFSPAEAQWVFVARKALGRIHQMTEGPQNGRPGYDFATVILDAPAGNTTFDHQRCHHASPARASSFA